MESNQSLMNDSSSKSSVELNDRKSSNNSNGDSGYHSDTGGYKGDGFIDDEYVSTITSKSLESTNKQHNLDCSLEYSTKNITNSKICSSSGATANDSECKLEIKSTTESKAATQHNSYVTSNNGVIKSCSDSTISNYDAFENMHVTATTENCMTHDCSLQEATHVYTTVASYIPTKTVHSYHSKDDLKTTVQDLALKIEFCLMFGYTVSQIKTAIMKLSYKSSKNDILAELSTIQSVAVITPTTLSMMTSLDESHYASFGGRVGELISKGVDTAQDSDLARGSGSLSRGMDMIQDSDALSRGPLSVDNDNNKENNSGRCIVDESENLRPIIIDGSNVAMSHGNKQYFSCKGILLAVDYFRNRNHRDITVFVPNYRKEMPRSDAPIKDRHILVKLEEERILVYTPSRYIKGKRVTCYDDRFILRLAEETDGIIVSNDHFRDLQNEKSEWKELVEKRLLMFSFVSDRFMPPDDPLGRNGPSINNFLRKRPANEEQSKRQCPYGKKCTYGKKCKFFHPEFARPVSERMKEKSEKRLKASSESVELALELIKAGDDHTLPLSPSIRDKLNSQAPSLHCGSSQGQASKSLSNSWKVDNTRARKIGNNAHEDSPSYPHNHSSNRLVSSPMSSDSPYSRSSQHPQNGANLSDTFRHLSLSNQYGVKQNPQMPSLQSNGQMCYDPHYPLMNDPSCVRFSAGSYVHAENNPLDYHMDSQTKYKNAIINRQYQHSSPANLAMLDRNSSANSVMHRQRMNANPPYPPVPGYQTTYPSSPQPMYSAGYHESPYTTNQHVYYNVSSHSQDNGGIHPSIIPSSSYYVAPINSSTGSNNSLSHTYPFVPLEKAVPPPNLSHHNLTNSSTGSEPKTYPPRAPRGYSSPNPQQHLQQSHYNSNSSFVQDVQSISPATRMTPSELPLSNVNNPRHYLYRNLCSLFQQHVVEAVMGAHPEIREPKVLVKMCLGSN